MPHDGPIQNYDGDHSQSRWSSRPGLARALRLLVLLLPIGGSFFVTWLAARYFPPADLGMNVIVWWVMVIIVASITMIGIERVARRGLPLVALLKMNLVFPEEAPSRFSTALRTGTTKQLERRVEEMRMLGLHDSPEVNYGQQMLELVAALNAHDRLTRGHCERVRAYTDMVIEEMGIEGDDANKLRWSALLHDVGKIMVPANILNKDGKPTNDEWELLKSHTWQGQAMVEPIAEWLGEWSRSVGEHHERWDGDGYPNGLAANEIHLGARIVAVTDAFDVMTSARSYKKPIPPEAAREEVARCSGTQFDPEVVRAFLNIGIGRLRLAVGPLTWLANIPSAGQISVAPAATPIANVGAAAVGAIATAITGGAGGILTPDPVPETPAAFADETPIIITTLPPTDTVAPPVVTIAVATVPPETTTTTSTSTSTTTTTEAPAATPTTTRAPSTPTTTITQPLANNGSIQTREDEPVEVVLSGAVGSGSPRFELTVQPQRGTLTPVSTANATTTAGEQRYEYTPDPDFSGTDVIRYEICDSAGRCDPGTIEITITAVNDAPVPVPDRIEAIEDAPITIPIASLTANDTDVDSPVTLESFSQPSNGSLTQDGRGDLVYTPAPGFEGRDSFTYTVTDGEESTTTTVTVIVAASQDNPVGGPDAFTSTEDQAVVLTNLLDNDRDDDPTDTISISSVTQPPNGTVGRNVIGDLVFTPEPNWSGTDTFTYLLTDDKGNLSEPVTVTVTLTAVNDSPVGGDDIGLTIDEEAALTIDWATLLANDTDIDSSSLTITSVDGGTSPATIVVDEAAQTIVVTGDNDFAGVVSFTYDVCDGADTPLCDGPISVTIDVANVNDTPVAAADTVQGFEDTAIDIPIGDVVANDRDADDAYGETWGIDSVATADGTALLDLAAGHIKFAPEDDRELAATIEYIICDDEAACDRAKITVDISPDNDAPIATDDLGFTTPEDTELLVSADDLLANDVDPDVGDTLQVTVDPLGNLGGQLVVDVTNPDEFTFSPASNVNGTETFAYEVCDIAGECDTATLTVEITPVNDAPVANDDGPFTIEVDVASSGFAAGPLLGNDTDPDIAYGDTLALTPETLTTTLGGSITIDTDGVGSYTPPAGVAGTDTFTYTIVDAEGATASATVTFELVNSINDAPVAVDDTVALPLEVETATTISGTFVLGNDTDADTPYGQTLTISGAASGPSSTTSTVTYDPVTDSFTYTSIAPHTGTDSFTYAVCDDAATPRCDLATVTLTVANTNDAPIANNDGPIIVEVDHVTTGLAVVVLDNDTDPDTPYGDTVSLVPGPLVSTLGGSANINPDGTGSYTPPTGILGTDTVVYTAIDSKGATASAIVTFEIVNSINDGPVAVDDTVTLLVRNGRTTSIPVADLLANDSDPDQPFGQTISINSVDDPSPNRARLTPSRSAINYRSLQGFVGPDSFTYEICDDHPTDQQCATATVSLIVTFANTTPVAENDDLGTISVDGTLLIDTATLLANDEDVDEIPFGQNLSVNAITAQPTGAGNVVQVSGTNIQITNVGTLGLDTFTYQVCDDHLTDQKCATATVTLEFVNPTNNAPVAVDDDVASFGIYNTDQGATLTIAGSDLLANDSDADNVFTGEQLELFLDGSTTGTVSTAFGGTATLSGAGDVTYVSNSTAFGRDSFSYEACDSAGACGTAMVYIDIRDVRNPPTITGLVEATSVEIFEETAIEPIIPGVTDPDPGDDHTWSIVGLPNGLTFDINTGQISGNPYIGSSKFGPANDGVYPVTVTVTDDGGSSLSDTRNITIVVNQWQASPLVGGLIISEVRAHETESTLAAALIAFQTDGTVADAGVFDEFVEVTNISSAAIDISGLRLTDHNLKDVNATADQYVVDSGAFGIFNINTSFNRTIPDTGPILLAPNATLVMWVGNPANNTGRITGPPGDLDFAKRGFEPAGPSPASFVMNHSVPMLGNNADEVYLIDKTGKLIDFVRWNNATSTDPNQSSPVPEGNFIAMDNIDVTGTQAGDSLSLATITGPAGADCWEATASNSATCGGALQTVDKDFGLNQPGNSSAGELNQP